MCPFSLGPGHTPIPAKLVSKILTGQFVVLADLIPENLDVPEQVEHTIRVFSCPQFSSPPQEEGGN